MIDSNDWPLGTFRLLARLATDEAIGKDFADWAVDALLSGFDSPSLRRLSAMSGERDLCNADTIPLFEASALELGLKTLTREEVLLTYLGERARAIAAGAENLDEILIDIHDRVVAPLDHSDDVVEWCYMWERALPNRVEPVDDDEIRAFARKWVAHHLPLPKP